MSTPPNGGPATVATVTRHGTTTVVVCRDTAAPYEPRPLTAVDLAVLREATVGSWREERVRDTSADEEPGRCRW